MGQNDKKRGSERKGPLYPPKPSKDWYTKSPDSTDISRQRYALMKNIGMAVETLLFAPLGQQYDPSDYYSLALRAYVKPRTNEFPTIEEVTEELQTAVAMLRTIGGAANERIGDKVRKVLDQPSRGTVHAENMGRAYWERVKAAGLSPAEVLQYIAIQWVDTLEHTPMSNIFGNKDLFNLTGTTSVASIGGMTSSTFVFDAQGKQKPSPERVEVNHFIVHSQMLKIVNYFLGEPPMHQNVFQMHFGPRRDRS